MKFIEERLRNGLIRKGLKKKANRVFHEVMVRLKKEGHPETIIDDIFERLRPKLRLVERKRGSTVYKLPSMIRKDQSVSLALKWFFRSVKERKERKLEDRVFGELKEILDEKGRSLKRKEEHYRLAIYNRGFIRFLKKYRR